MSFLGGVKRIFGLTDDEMDEQDYVVSDRNSAEDVVTEVKKNNDVEIFDEQGEIPDGVFDGLIEIVNSNLSPLVLKCIDVEAEKKYLYDALGTRFADFVKATREKSLNAARVEWEKEKYELKSKAEEMKSRCATAEAEMNDMKAMKMSEERQRLALKERIRKLEEQVEAVEAEKEQRLLENKSLLNKLKVANVRGGDNEEAEREMQALTQQVEDLKQQLAQATANNSVSDEMKAEVEELKATLTEKDNAIGEMQAKLEESQQTITKLQEEFAVAGVELVKAQNELNKANADLANASENLALLDEIQAQLVLVEEFKKNKEEEIQGLKAQISNLEAEKEQAVKNAVGSEADKFEELINESEKECAELKERVAELEQELSACNDRIGALAKENVDTLDALRARDEEVEQHKQVAEANAKRAEELNSDIDALKEEISVLKDAHSREINELKSAEVTKTQNFQAEIAELQAKLNVTGKVDDLLVDDDFRQEVDDVFDKVEAKEDDLDAFSVIEEELLMNDDMVPSVSDALSSESSSAIEDDADISWLLPDEDNMVETIVFDEEEVVETPASDKSDKKEEEGAPEVQMSLF